MKYENIIHNHGSKKAQTQSISNIRQEEVVKKEQNYVCIVFQALNQEHCFQKELEPEIPEKSPKSLTQKAQIWFKFCLVERKCTKAKHLFMLLFLHHVFEKYILFCFFFPPAVASTLLVWMQIQSYFWLSSLPPKCSKTFQRKKSSFYLDKNNNGPLSKAKNIHHFIHKKCRKWSSLGQNSKRVNKKIYALKKLVQSSS